MSVSDRPEIASNSKDTSRWRPWIYLVAGLAVTSMVWRLAAYERHRSAERAIAIAAASIAADIRADVDSRTRSLLDFAERWERAAPSGAEWELETGRQIGTHAEYRTIEWVDSSFRVRRVFPSAAGNYRARRDRESLARLKALIKSAAARRGWTFSPSFEHPEGGRAFMFCAPVYRHARLEGLLIVTLRHRELWQSVYQDHAGLGFQTAICEPDGQVLWAQVGEGEYKRGAWEHQTEVRFPGTIWQVRVQPGPQLLAKMKFRWDEAAFLVFGVALSVLLKVTAGQSQASIRLANKIRLANMLLEREIDTRRRTEAALQASRTRLALIMDIAAESAISTDAAARITLFNRGAEETFGYRADEVLGRPLEMLIPERYRERHRQHFQAFGISSEATQLLGQLQPVFGLRKDGQEFPAQGSISKLELQNERVFTVMLRDVSDAKRAEEALRKAYDEMEQRVQERTAELAEAIERLRAENLQRRAAEESLEQLSGRLLNLQDEERRRIARELHDSTVQTLAAVAIGIGLAQEESAKLSAAARDALASSASSTDECLRELRNLSYLLHPPLLDGMGLAAALDGLAAGFSKRSGIFVDLSVPRDFGRLPTEVETALFRIAQESLTNVYRYSGSPTAMIRLSTDRNSNDVTLEVADQGTGVPAWILDPDNVRNLGVGIPGMRARIKQLGGRLEVISGSSGTTVRASLVLPAGGS